MPRPVQQPSMWAVLLAPLLSEAEDSLLSYPQVVNFAKQLCEFPDTVEQFLQTLGEGKWMPAGLATSRGGGTVVASSSADFVLMAKYLGEWIAQTHFRYAWRALKPSCTHRRRHQHALACP